MRIPNKITPCPIVEAIIELRFNSILPDDAVFGVIYNVFRNEYGKVEKLPILQLPDNIRSQEPNLVYKPHYKLHKDDFIIQIGPKVISFANIREYVGWNVFSQKVLEGIQKVSNLDIIRTIKRFGLRYINLFEDLNICKKSTLKLQLGETELSEKDVNLTVALKTGDFLSKLIVLNNAEVQLNLEKKTTKGSLIDIDVALEKENKLESIIDIVENAHSEEKKMFFSILAPEFLETLNPEY